ncbi:MAG: tetratricopeptide repeat protein [Candidatus Binatus sp.]
MAKFAPGYPAPRSADEFERLCLKLLRRHWQLPQLERFRDPERAEKGVNLIEISGRPRLAAVKCDLRASRNELTVAEIKDAVDQAASLKLPIGRFVIATTAAKPEGLQRALFDLNRANRKDGISAIEVLTWDDIEELLDEYPQILTDFGTAAKRQALTRADAVVHLEARCEPATAGPSDALGEEISAAAAFLESHQYQLARLALLRLREQKWSQLSNSHKFRVLSYLGAAWLKEGEPRKSAMLFIAAKSLQPDEENACTNEALAHEILGEHERAFALSDKLRMQFPSSGRAVALWLNNAPKSFDARTLEENVAPELASDPEVAVVMARRALQDAHFDRAERYARLASAALPNNPIPWLVLGQAILLNELESGVGAPDAPAQSDEGRVREAESCFTQAVTLAQSEHQPSSEVQALIGRAQARIALRDTDGAGKDIEQAHSLEREDANGLCEYGIVLRSRGSLTEAIEVLRRAAAVGGRDDIDYHLAVTLRERDEPGDLQEATELLTRAISRPEAIPAGDFPFAVAAAVEALSTTERYHDADALLSSIADGRLTNVTLRTLRANLRLAQGKFDQASKLADEALSCLTPDVSADNRRKLAALLHDLGRYRDALPLWQALAPAGSAGTDTRRLLDCASRLGREDIVSDISRQLQPEKAIDAGAIADQLDKLERNDPEAALARLEEMLHEHPDDRVLRLRRSIVAARVGKPDLVVADPNAMPPAREIPPALGRAAVQFMRDGSRANEALAYAYELLRHQGGSVDAHRAYLAALGPVGPMPHVPDFDSAGPGAALSFVEEGSNTEKWIMLEDANDADEALDEYGPQHPMTRAVKGKKAGEKFQLPEGRFSRRQASVKQMISKYAYRYMDVLINWQARFPGQAEIEMSYVRADAIPWNEMADTFEPLFEATSGSSNGVANGNGAANGKANGAANGSGTGKRDYLLKQAERTYADNSIPIHAVADRLNLNDLQTVFILAQRPEAPLKCCTGSPEELEAALGAFERANAVVLDLTAIATLCMLGRLSLLPTWPRQFVISQSTLAELRRQAFEDTLLRLPPGFSASITGTANDGKRADVQLKGLADALQSVCRVRDGAVLASIDPERRERLVNFFGRHGAESIVIASMPGHVLWTDDMILADLAKTEFGVRRVWTEAALQARAQAGNLDPSELATASTKLAGWGYSFTTPSIETLMRAGSVAVWNPDQFPLKQALDQFASESMNMSDAVRLAAELIVKMYNDQYLRGQRRTVTSRLLDRLATRPGGRDAIETLPRSLPIRFGLDLIRARELSDVVRGWAAQSETPQNDRLMAGR